MADESRPAARGRARVDYQPARPAGLRVRRGDELSVAGRDERPPGRLWCSSADGRAGWVPEQVVALVAAGVGVARCDYPGEELALTAGEALALEPAAGGWYLAVRDDGRSGWVPAECVEVLDEE